MLRHTALGTHNLRYHHTSDQTREFGTCTSYIEDIRTSDLALVLSLVLHYLSFPYATNIIRIVLRLPPFLNLLLCIGYKVDISLAC